MGCTCSTQEGSQPSQRIRSLELEAPNSAAATCHPVPFGHIPYIPALPGILGPLTGFPVGWWYYAGWATDMSGTTQYSILTQIIRVGQDPIVPGITIASILYGIGIKTPDSDSSRFITQLAPGGGDFPSPTSTSWSISSLGIGEATMTCKLVAGTLGLSGATYKLEMADQKQGVALSILLKDALGTVMEGASGIVHEEGKATYEVAMPSLSIQEGSTISIDGNLTPLRCGNLWLDRQTKSGTSDPHQIRPFYTGTWLPVHMNDGTVYSFWFYFKPQPVQWIVGSELDPPVPPVNKIGIEYPALKDWNGSSPVQGAHVLEATEFDLNILKPKDPQESPHWKSKTSGHTYCTAWQLRIRDQVYSITVMLPDSEVYAGTYFFEGAATVSPLHTRDVEVGHAFVEQMGYN